MSYIFDGTRFHNELDVIHKKLESFIANVDNTYVSEYKDVDWKQADIETFLKMYWPRRSERGFIHSDKAKLFIDLCFEYKPKLILEIGSMAGVSTRLLAALAKRNDGKLISVDAGRTTNVEPDLKSLNLLDTVILVNEWSPWIVPNYDWELDLLFIDGDHSLMSVIADYHYFNYFLKKDGIVTFDNMEIEEVREAVEIIKKRDALEQIASMYGIIVFRKLTERKEKYFQILR